MSEPRRSSRITRGVAPLRFQAQSTPSKLRPRVMANPRGDAGADSNDDRTSQDEDTDDEPNGAGEGLDSTIVSADVHVPASEDEAVDRAEDNRSDLSEPLPFAGWDLATPASDNERAEHINDDRSDRLNQLSLADLRLQIAVLQQESALHKRARDNYKRELASIKLAAQSSARRQTSDTSSLSTFAGMAESSVTVTRPGPANAATSSLEASTPLLPHTSASLYTTAVSPASTGAPPIMSVAAAIASHQTSYEAMKHGPRYLPNGTTTYQNDLMQPHATTSQNGSSQSVPYQNVHSGVMQNMGAAQYAPTSRPLVIGHHVPYSGPVNTPSTYGQAHAGYSLNYAPPHSSVFVHQPVAPAPVHATGATSATVTSVRYGAGYAGYAAYNLPALIPPSANAGLQFAQFSATAEPQHYPSYSQCAPDHATRQHSYMQNMPAPQPVMQPLASYMQPIPVDARHTPFRRLHDLPTFSGRAEEWPLFICSYTMTTQQFAYTDVENMLRLQKCLTGDAKKRVESILIRPEHVGRAVDALAKRFGSPKTLVESQINLARSLPKIEDHDLRQMMDMMVDFSVSVDGLVTFLDSEATQHHLTNPTLLNELECKLPTSERLKWAAVARHLRPYPTLRDFALWLDDAASLMASITTYESRCDSIQPTRSRQDRTIASKQKSSTGHVLLNVATEMAKKPLRKCSYCSEEHDIRSCAAFLRLSVHSRLQEIKQKPICYGCLCEGHLLPGCNDRKMCGQNGCERWHDPLLHDEEGQSSVRQQPSKKHQRQNQRGQGSVPKTEVAVAIAASQPQAVAPAHQSSATTTSTTSATSSDGSSNVRLPVLNCRAGRSDHLLLFRVVPVILYGPQRNIETFALLDEGSSLSLIDADLVNELGLEGVETDLELQFANAQGQIQASREVRFGISGVQSDAQRFEMSTVYATSSLTLPIQTVRRSEIVDNNEHLRDVPFAEYDGARPRVLIGLDHHHLGIPLQIRTSALANGIVAAMTKIGWVLFGTDGRSPLPGAVVLHVRHPNQDDGSAEDERWGQLHELVRQHFTTEDFGVKASTAIIESDDLARARHILASTTKRVGQRFETGLLWARDEVELPDSRAMALQRLTGIESRMRRDAGYAQQYRAQIQAYLDKGYARRATAEEAAQRGGRAWFLPHFAVQSVSKPGKFRLVFDAAAKVADVSLNTALLAGPDVNAPLTRLLFRFRLGTIGVCADVREMYHQVRIRHEDQTAQRFFWRGGDVTVAPEVFIMNVMTFGSTCSPASAQYVKNLNATEFEDDYPEAADAIRNNHYVDDYVASFGSSSEATRITSEVVDIQIRGGFELRGIVSNCPEVQSHFGEVETHHPVELEPGGAVQKILGMTWETTDDAFCFQTRFGRVRPGIMDGTQRPSKRDVLSVTMSIFDPFGLLADFLLASKVILQELWRANLGWDEPIPDSLNARWQSWRALLERTRLVRIPRCYSPSISHAPGLQLHVFADASEEAFAAVAYWRIHGNNGVELAFVAGKVRCAPIKLLSIPRMELQAAMLAARLMREIRESHAELDISETVLWSDSETVLKWLRCDKRRYKVFVAIRVAEIVETAPAAWWRWVPSALNAADDATRVRTPLTFDPESRWLRGPVWLMQNESSWPIKPVVETFEAEDEEVRARFVGSLVQRGAVDYSRFCNFYKLIRAVAWVRRFASNARERLEQRVKGELSSDEVRRAMETTCRLIQLEAFGGEVATLRDGGQLAANNPIFAVKPYLDEGGLLRVHGRTDAADDSFISSEAKRPILLPRTHHVTMLMVKHYHEQLAHQLVDATIAAVRATYWVPQLRVLVNQVRRNCQSCRVRTAMPVPTSQGQLPRDRMDAYARPFTNTGLDFFGPVLVTVGRRHEKRWVALFTCLTVRAVHLEIAADLSTDACLLCIRNLCNIRGVPSLIRCDNGTNLVGARNELNREEAFFDSDAIQRELSVKGVKWRLNCPGNPEAGGAWERLVQCVKKVLRVTLHEDAPRTETLRSLLNEAANMVNARPLTHLQVTPDDPDPLTPNHFLIGGPNVATVPNPADVDPSSTRKQWKICRSLSRRFWRQFVRDYLPELTRRGKHYPEQPPLRVGDLVIICDAQQPRSRWSRGRIIEVATAPDGVVRTATVKTASGTCKRPATKLARLDVCASDGSDGRGAECRQLEGVDINDDVNGVSRRPRRAAHGAAE